MNTLSKIFLTLIIVLIIALSIITFKYLKLRDLVYENLGDYDFSNYNKNTIQEK